jgi:hypothetical protein
MPSTASSSTGALVAVGSFQLSTFQKVQFSITAKFRIVILQKNLPKSLRNIKPKE